MASENEQAASYHQNHGSSFEKTSKTVSSLKISCKTSSSLNITLKIVSSLKISCETGSRLVIAFQMNFSLRTTYKTVFRVKLAYKRITRGSVCLICVQSQQMLAKVNIG